MCLFPGVCIELFLVFALSWGGVVLAPVTVVCVFCEVSGGASGGGASVAPRLSKVIPITAWHIRPVGIGLWPFLSIVVSCVYRIYFQWDANFQ